MREGACREILRGCQKLDSLGRPESASEEETVEGKRDRRGIGKRETDDTRS